MDANSSQQLVSAADTSVSPVQPSEMEIMQKTFLDKKTKMVEKRSGQFVCAADTCDSTVRPFEIEI